MLGETIDRIVTYFTGGVVLFPHIKSLFGKIFANPELARIVTEKLVEIAKGGRTRGDELVFFASLISLPGIDAKNKELFLEKFHELLHPDFSGKNPDQIEELTRKEKLAEGLIFLIAEDKTVNDKERPFRFANQVWYGMFLEINNLPNDNAKRVVLEQRILLFGKNHQEKKNLQEIAGKIWHFTDSSAEKLGNGISSVVKLVNHQYDEQEARARERRRRRKKNKLNWLNPALLLESFLDLR